MWKMLRFSCKSGGNGANAGAMAGLASIVY